MRISFYLIALNHHQSCLADELFDILGEGFSFVELANNQDKKGSLQDFSSRPYLIRSWLNSQQKATAMTLLESSDVCVFGGVESLPYMRLRLEMGRMAFYVSERWLKCGLINVLSPQLRQVFRLLRRYSHHPLYLLSASAYAASDYKRLQINNCCYKWGYFTGAQESASNIQAKSPMSASNKVSILWCSRFIRWKHPELAIELARRLYAKGYDFTLDMYGGGDKLEFCKKKSNRLGLSANVFFKGFASNEKILQAMREHDIFILTSDRNEGWGVVLNESMGSGCAVVASDAAGAAPFLIENSVNGLMFKSNNIESLYEKVVYMIENPADMHRMAVNAFHTINTMWSPKTAAHNLVHLCNCLLNGQELDITEGPGSIDLGR